MEEELTLEIIECENLFVFPNNIKGSFFVLKERLNFIKLLGLFVVWEFSLFFGNFGSNLIAFLYEV